MAIKTYLFVKMLYFFFHSAHTGSLHTLAEMNLQFRWLLPHIQKSTLSLLMKVITWTPSSFKYWAEILHLFSACLENRKLISMTKPNTASVCQVISHCRWLLRVYHCANPYTNLYHPLVTHNLKGTLTTNSLRSIQSSLCEMRIFFSSLPLMFSSPYLLPAELMQLIYIFFPFLFDEVYCWLSRASGGKNYTSAVFLLDLPVY